MASRPRPVKCMTEPVGMWLCVCVCVCVCTHGNLNTLGSEFLHAGGMLSEQKASRVSERVTGSPQTLSCSDF